MDVSIEDDGQLRRLVMDIAEEMRTVPQEVRKVIAEGAANVRDDLNDQAAASRHFKGMAGSVTYDMKGNAYFSEAEIGPDKGRTGGALGNIFFFGGANGGGGTGDLDGALRREGPRLTSAMGDVLRGIL